MSNVIYNVTKALRKKKSDIGPQLQFKNHKYLDLYGHIHPRCRCRTVALRLKFTIAGEVFCP